MSNPTGTQALAKLAEALMNETVSQLEEARADSLKYGYGFVRVDSFGRLQRISPEKAFDTAKFIIDKKKREPQEESR